MSYLNTLCLAFCRYWRSVQLLSQFLWKYFLVALLIAYLEIAIAVPAYAVGLTSANSQGNIYSTYGTHNPPHYSKCDPSNCIYTRKSGEPTDPEFPVHWTSNWDMYRVFKKYEEFLPPYNNPPSGLKEGIDYEVSTGTTYYDSEWSSHFPRWPGIGAMREKYNKRCLPIFPISNHFSCSFISLGDTAIFQTYPEDRPPGMPEYCLFSRLNYPPHRDFIKHLPYSAGDSANLKNRIQGYSFWLSRKDGKPIQIGVSPYHAVDAIMFGYAFWREPSPDASEPQSKPYRHPQSFYFSGYPKQPANAPIVSQNYTDFSMRKPPPETWSKVEALNPEELPACKLF